MTARFVRILIVAVTISATVPCFLDSHASHSAPQPGGIQRGLGFQDLAGYWSFELDPGDAGLKQQWFTRRFRSHVKLPGTIQAQGFGFEVGTTTPWVATLYDRFWYLRDDYKDYTTYGKGKVPFLSQPQRHYLGPAWYQREIDIPQNLEERRVTLTLERPHWETTVWVDTTKIGSDRSLVAPHIYNLGHLASGKHRLTIRIDNRMILPYRPDAHSVSDAAGATWNGIIGRIELNDTGRVWIDDAQVFPNLKQMTMTIKVKIGNVTGRSGAGTITAIWPDVGIVPVNWDENGGTAELEVPIRLDAEKWSEFHPGRVPLRIWLKGQGFEEYKDLNVGLRDLTAKGKEFLLNEKPIYLRGTNNDGVFPLTGVPPTDVKSWQQIFETCQKWGLNHMRFHSWCPPEAAFEAADQIGFYLQPEPGLWNDISPGTDIERALYDETDRMIKAYGNHPSFMLLSPSNEPKGKWKEALSKWVEHYRHQDPRRLYANGSGHTEREAEGLAEGTDYVDAQRVGGNMLRRESGWYGSDYRDALTDIEVPVIAHEVGQWAAYPDFEIIKKFTGFLKAGNYEIFRDSLMAHGLLSRNKDFVQASGRFQVDCYKEDIEANLRTPGLSGFQLLGLNDYLGQGTAPVGLLDAFGESKGYVDADEFKKFCNAVVPLARLPRRIFTTDDTFDVNVEIANFGAEEIQNAKVVWRIAGRPFDPKGEWPTQTIPIGKNIYMGKISFNLATFVAPGEYSLSVTLAPVQFFNAAGEIEKRGGVVPGVTYFQNEWKFWVYPTGLSNPEEVPMAECPRSRVPDLLITSSWDEAEERLANGGKVLFCPKSVDLGWNSPPLDAVPIFWNRSITPGWSRMLGLWFQRKVADSRNYTLARFPSDSYFDWQWAEVIRNVRAINLDRFPDLEPTVWAIDDWNRNYKLGVIFEGAVGDGKLLVSAIDVSNPIQSNPVMLQLRRSLVQYAKSDCFQPQVQVVPGAIRGLLFDTQIMRTLGATVRAQGENVDSVIDGDPTTFWRAGDRTGVIRDQLELQIDFPVQVPMSGLIVVPRQNQREHEGDIKDYVIQISDDGNEWRDVVRGELLSTFKPQRIAFAKAVTGRYLKLVVLSGFGTDKTTALAELAVIGPKAPPKKGKAN